MTNSIHHATKLVERNVPTVIIGGKVKSSTDASIGGIALNQIGQLNFDKAFLGMNGIDDEFYSTPDLEEGSVKRAIIENAKKTYILADDSKIGVTSFVKVAPIKRAMIITNQCEPQRLKVLKGKNGGYRGLIYTVTLNPAIDYIVRLDHVETGAVNRMASEDKFAGGKGINVSRVLKRLDIENTATGFIGGFTGRFIEDVLTSEDISTNFVTVDQDTRINVKIKADEETEINGNGPEVTEAQLQELLNILSSLTADDVVVFAGSAPSSLGNAVYKELIATTRATGAQVVCDFEGQTLIDSLEFNPQWSNQTTMIGRYLWRYLDGIA